MGVFGSRPSWAACIIAPRKLWGVHCCSFGSVERAVKTIRVKRSGVMTEGRAFLICGSMALMSPLRLVSFCCIFCTCAVFFVSPPFVFMFHVLLI